ncbi:hypothetical protein Q7P37_002330 [Cladosporium fusiforme]
MFGGAYANKGGKRRRPALEPPPPPRRSARLQGNAPLPPPPLASARRGTASQSSSWWEDVGRGPRGSRSRSLPGDLVGRSRAGRTGGFDRDLFGDRGMRRQQAPPRASMDPREAFRQNQADRNLERDLHAEFERQTLRDASRRDDVDPYYGRVRDNPARRPSRSITSGYPLPAPPDVLGGPMARPRQFDGSRMNNPQADMLLGAAPLPGLERGGTPMPQNEEDQMNMRMAGDQPRRPGSYRTLRPMPPRW